MSLDVNMVLMCFFVFFARICDVSCMSLRTILLTKGMPKLAAVFGFFEVLIYIVVLGKVIDSLNEPLYLIFYGLGFSTGNFVGSKIESMLAFGDAQMRIVLSCNEDTKEAVDELRDLGFGVTVFRGEGRDGEKAMLLINLKRKRINEIYSYFKKKNLKAFISTNDITSYAGGYQLPPKSSFLNMVKK